MDFLLGEEEWQMKFETEVDIYSKSTRTNVACLLDRH
jgi:hypothetical protein